MFWNYETAIDNMESMGSHSSICHARTSCSLVCVFIQWTVTYLISALENKFKDSRDAHGDGYQVTLLSEAEICNALEM